MEHSGTEVGGSVGLRRKPRFYYGWVIVATVALASFTQSAGTFPVLGVLLGPITDEFGWSHTVFIGATTVGTIAGGVVAIFIGPLLDRFGGRWILVASMAILGGTFVLLAFVQSLWQFYVLQIFGRIMTMGIIGLTLQVIIPKWFVVKRGRAVALAGLGIMAGNTVTPLYVQLFVDISNWRVAAAVAGSVIWAVSLIPCAVFLRRQPEDMGLLPDGRQPHAADSLDTPDGGVADAAEQSGEISYGVRQVLRLPSFYLLATAFTLAFMVGPGLILHMIPYFTDRGLEAGQAVWIVAMWSASGSLGSLMFGLLTERFGARLVLAADFFLMALCIFWLLFIQSLPVGLVWGFFLGLTMGGMMVLYQVIFADYYGRNSLGAIRGVIWPVQMGSNSMGPLSVALVFDSTDSYIPIFAVFGVLTLAAALCVFLARPPQPVGSAPEAVQETSPSTVVASSAVDGDG